MCDGQAYEYAYDSQGNLKEKRSNGKRLVSYAYDKAGKVTEIRNPSGVNTYYEYDLLGRVNRIHNRQGMEVCYGYDSLNRIRKIRYGNGVETAYAYDCDGNISRLETKTESAVLLSLTYQYDGNGNRTVKTGIQGLTEGSNALDVTYRYDVRGQLLEERRNGISVRYTYDAAGNRLRKTEKSRETNYHYNRKNQLIRKEEAGGIKYFTYDRQGGIVEEKGPSGIRKFTYNSRHQQTRIELEDGRIQKNRYDAEGLRYELLENGKSTYFVYHNGELLHEKGEDAGQPQKETSYYLGAGIEAFQRDQKTFYYHQDEQLNTAFVSDEKGTVKNQYRYDAFGAGLEELPNRIRYTGQQYDRMTGQYYLRARYYNPTLGRFMQEDVYQGDGMNLYAYCRNNPVTYYDPSGYAETEFSLNVPDLPKDCTWQEWEKATSGSNEKKAEEYYKYTGKEPHDSAREKYIGSTTVGKETREKIAQAMEGWGDGYIRRNEQGEVVEFRSLHDGEWYDISKADVAHKNPKFEAKLKEQTGIV